MESAVVEDHSDMCGNVGRPVSLGALLALLVLHAVLLFYGARIHSPGWDEVGHLPAGLSHWELGNFDLYHVNPPLVRMVAAVPLLTQGIEMEWRWRAGRTRPEWPMGWQLFERYGADAHGFLTAARWACIPFSILAALVCFWWGRALYGEAAGVFASILWCACPNVLGNAALITPDVGAAALGVAACLAFRHWFLRGGWNTAAVAGLVLGLALLTKFTWVVLVPLFSLLWLGLRARRAGQSTGGAFLPVRSRCAAPKPAADRESCAQECSAKEPAVHSWRPEAGQMGLLLVVALVTINAGYGFEGSGRRLGDYRFVSVLMNEEGFVPTAAEPAGNRFAHSMLGRLPVPLPANYLLGMDRQRLDFERRLWSYLRGEWRRGGWWYYYLYAMAVKMPLGTWGLLFLAGWVGLCRTGYAASRAEELLLVAPALVLLVAASAQTGFNHHLRYVLPAFPFAFVWASKVARSWTLGHRSIFAIAVAALAWSVGSSLWVYPHSLSYFNEAAGGPHAGWRHLAHSNTDWGQNLHHLRHWLDRHPEVELDGRALDTLPVVVRALDLGDLLPPPGPDSAVEPHPGVLRGPRLGWYALSVNQIYHYRRDYRYFDHFQPVATVAYSIRIYHITPDEANRVRRELGMAELKG